MYSATPRSVLLLLLLGAHVETALALPRRAVFSWAPTHVVSSKAEASDTVESFPELGVLFEGNRLFRHEIDNSSNPHILTNLTEKGQSPDFAFIGCSDSRASEGTIFSAEPGMLFTQRNIANQYSSADPNAASVLSYAIAKLKVGHVIVMGHYGCGGVGASIASAPEDQTDVASRVIHSWIEPIRRIYENSKRAEIVELRQANANKTKVGEPKISDPGFRALVEENVKHSVEMITKDPVIQDHWETYTAQEGANGSLAKGKPVRHRAQKYGSPLKPVFVHGFVYDIKTGEVTDLRISRGPPGIEIKSRAVTETKHHAETSLGDDHHH